MKKNSNFINITSEKKFNDEIDLVNFVSLIFRNKVLIGSISLISFFIACLQALSLKKIWQGEFQIVLDSEKVSTMSNNSVLSNLVELNNSNNLKTQVEILKSPSVLMPLYDLVNGKNKADIRNQIPFYKWQSRLEIDLLKGTSILNIAYRDSNKEMILPALQKMSSIYQDYSVEIKQRKEEKIKKYLINQIDLFREKSGISIKAAQDYAIDQDMIYLGKGIDKNNSESTPNEKPLTASSGFVGIPSIINIENIRVQAANQLRTIDLQIKKINELDQTDYENLQYFGSSIPALEKEGLPETLKDIESRLVVLRTKFTENDPSIIQLLEQRKLTIDLLRSRAIKYLKVAKLEAEAKMEAASRPKGVLLKYRELIREAARDEETLLSLEKSLRTLRLQQAKTSEPWQLITEPTLLTEPVGPSRRNIALIGLLAGSFLGILLSIFKEKKSGKVYSLQQLENVLSASFLGRINKNDQFIDSNEKEFLKIFLKNQNVHKITFFTLEEINKSYLENLKNFINNDVSLNKKINLISSQNQLEACNKSDFTILFTSLGFSSYNEMITLNKKFQLLNIDFKGFIILD